VQASQERNEQRACQNHHHKLGIIVVIDKINTNDVYFQDTKAKDSKFKPVTLLFLHHPIFPGEIYTSCDTVRYQHILLASLSNNVDKKESSTEDYHLGR